MDINTKLKKLLEDSGQRQAEVAQKCGLTPANLSRALTRDHNLNLSAADTSLNWDDVEAILGSLGFYLEFDWR